MTAADAGPGAEAPPVPPVPPDEPDIRGSGLLLLAVALLIAIGFVIFRDRLPYPLQPPPGPAALAGGRGASPSLSFASVGPVSPASTPPSSAPSGPAPSLGPSDSTTPPSTPRPTATARPTATPRPLSDRFAVLRPCPGSGCWIYRVRSGDNLYSIANWFGVPLARIYEMNTWLWSTGLRPGQELRLPRPTR